VGGDHAGGLALAIAIIMLLMVVGGVALFFFVARALTRNLAPRRRLLVTLLMTLVGTGLACLLVMATFYESSWSPPPRLHLLTAPASGGPIVILEDPGASGTMIWRGGWLPFTAATAEISVPPSGILRVRSFGSGPMNAMMAATWPDGRVSPGTGGGPGPPGTGANAYLVIERPDAPYPGVLMSAEPPAVAAYVAEHEGRR
jgi:hypothetical protein